MSSNCDLALVIAFRTALFDVALSIPAARLKFYTRALKVLARRFHRLAAPAAYSRPSACPDGNNPPLGPLTIRSAVIERLMTVLLLYIDIRDVALAVVVSGRRRPRTPAPRRT